jgi:hypothetical protein
MKHFLFEDREHSYRPSFRRGKAGPDSAKALARLLGRGPRPGGGASSGGGQRKSDARQKCTAKMQYSKSIEAHRVQLEKYLAREGTGREGGPAGLYGTDIDEYREHMADKNFRIFLSPQSDKADLTALAERFVKKMEIQTGYKLYWQAANHYNTAHPHAHLLINGVDKEGREVTFPRDVVKTFMRETARDLCTSQLGIRTKDEIALDKEKELTAPRYTRLDDTLKTLCNGGFRVNLDAPLAGGRKPLDRPRLLARLEALRKMNLCTWKEGGYKLAPKWEDSLRANGRYNAFLKARDELEYTPAHRLHVYSGEMGKITGRVSKVYRTDGDASNNHAVILEGVNGRAYFVPLFKAPEVKDGRVKIPLREGAYISLTTYESQTGRLTPTMQIQSLREVQKEIDRQGYTGRLAQSMAQGPVIQQKEKSKGLSNEQ